MASRRRASRVHADPELDEEREQLASQIAEALGPWFPRAQRDLAWRRTRDPYAIWVSEIMLQQTRVDTVARYYPSFLARFPDVARLAAAREQDVLESWSGLGYYRRARLLHRGARYVHESLGGRMPRDAEGLLAIPGIGRYTAGAVASIAFDEPVPLVDGNVARVLSRLQAIEDPREQGADAPAHWEIVRAILERGTPRILAQALMELGAIVCTPRAPACAVCPVASLCRSRTDGLVDAIPAPRKKPSQPTQRFIAAAVTWRGRLLLVRRPAEGLLADMWCLPLRKVSGRAPRGPAAATLRRWLGAPAEASGAPLPVVKHVFTHRIWEMHPLRIAARGRPSMPGLEPDRLAFIAPHDRPPGGIPSVTEKLLRALGY